MSVWDSLTIPVITNIITVLSVMFVMSIPVITATVVMPINTVTAVGTVGFKIVPPLLLGVRWAKSCARGCLTFWGKRSDLQSFRPDAIGPRLDHLVELFFGDSYAERAVLWTLGKDADILLLYLQFTGLQVGCDIISGNAWINITQVDISLLTISINRL